MRECDNVKEDGKDLGQYKYGDQMLAEVMGRGRCSREEG